MNTSTSSSISTSAHRWPILHRVLASIAAFLLVMALVVLFFPWDMLRVPINRYVTGQLGRRFEITRHLSVDLGRTTTVRADGLEFANSYWAKEPYLVKATAAEFDVKLWSLLLGKVELPRVSLTDPQLGLQIEPDGRRTWALSRDTSDLSASPNIGALLVDHGIVKYLAPAQGATSWPSSRSTQKATGHRRLPDPCHWPTRPRASGAMNRLRPAGELVACCN